MIKTLKKWIKRDLERTPDRLNTAAFVKTVLPYSDIVPGIPTVEILPFGEECLLHSENLYGDE